MQLLETSLEPGHLRRDFAGVPLVIGIAGHRDVPAAAKARLREQFDRVLDEIERLYPSTQLLVLTPLARGADLLAAQAALERKIPVIGVLPQDTSAYETELSARERVDFDNVLKGLYDRVSAPDAPGAANKYAGASEYVADYANILVAFWDGVDGVGIGGTSYSVDLRLAHGDVADAGPVYQIVTPREGKEEPENCFSIRRHYPHPRRDARIAERDFCAALGRLDRFNRDALRNARARKEHGLLDLQQRASALADRYQAASLNAMSATYLLALTAGLALILENRAATLLITFPLIFLALCVFLLARRLDLENCYQDYRALSEALRVQYAWCCAGLQDARVDRFYLRMQQSELQWIRMALRTAFLALGGRDAVEGCGPAHEGCRDWIHSQCSYYRHAGRREVRKKHLFERLEMTATVLAMCCAFAALFLDHFQQSSFAAWALKVFGCLGIVAVLARFYEQQRGFGENARRYENMYAVFERARADLDNVYRGGSQSSHAAVLEETGREALAEHAYWLVLRRERPLTFMHV
ncbi:MAG TPA: hypothetical protein VFA29_13825 [Candidatus Baltobacteraceae bacterium]|nr:hypothetical protein [Candidatus Baltobacteraceae bacterium]